MGLDSLRPGMGGDGVCKSLDRPQGHKHLRDSSHVNDQKPGADRVGFLEWEFTCSPSLPPSFAADQFSVPSARSSSLTHLPHQAGSCPKLSWLQKRFSKTLKALGT